MSERFPIYESIPINTRVERGKYRGASSGYPDRGPTWEGVARVDGPPDVGVVDYAPAPPGYIWVTLTESTIIRRPGNEAMPLDLLRAIVELWPLRETIIVGPPPVIPRMHGSIPR